MKSYKVLNDQVFSSGEFSIVPIRYVDRMAILQCRNSQIYHLSFGMTDSVTAIVSVKKDKEFYVQKFIGTTLTMFTRAFCCSDVIISIKAFFNRIKINR